MVGINTPMQQEAIIHLNIILRNGRVVVPHPKKDLPIGTVKNILKQAQIKLI